MALNSLTKIASYYTFSNDRSWKYMRIMKRNWKYIRVDKLKMNLYNLT